MSARSHIFTNRNSKARCGTGRYPCTPRQSVGAEASHRVKSYGLACRFSCSTTATVQMSFSGGRSGLDKCAPRHFGDGPISSFRQAKLRNYHSFATSRTRSFIRRSTRTMISDNLRTGRVSQPRVPWGKNAEFSLVAYQLTGPGA